MKITLIRPNLFAKRSTDAMEPLGLAILKALTPPEVEVVCYDDRVESVEFADPTALVGLTVEAGTARRAYQIAAEYRRRGVSVVMGGHHPTLLPEEAGHHADAIVLGDAEGAWERVVEDAGRGRLQGPYRSTASGPLTGPPPDRSLYRGKRYAPVSLFQYGRGCKFNCDFCSIRAFYGSDLRQRPVADLVAEIEAVGPRHIFFVDDNLFVDAARARELFEALVPLGVRWSCQVSIDATRDPALVRLMAKSGCLSALIGFESLDQRNLRQMKKRWNLKWGDYATAISVLRDAGILIYGTFILGYDHDTTDTFDVTLDFALRHKLFLANFNPLTPSPGTPLYQRLAKQGRLLYDRWWLDPRYRYGEATFRPRGMSAGELTRGCYRTRTAFNTYSSIARRLIGRRGNLRNPYQTAVYLLSNLVSRREIHSKQGRRLGDPSLPDPPARYILQPGSEARTDQGRMPDAPLPEHSATRGERQ